MIGCNGSIHIGLPREEDAAANIHEGEAPEESMMITREVCDFHDRI